MTKDKRDDNPNANGSSPESGEQKRQRASLRSMEADLKVIVGKDGGGENPDGEREVFWHFSQVLASQSGYIDTLLSTSLPTSNDSNPSKDHKEIVFTDITPSQWERMVRFITNPFAWKSVTYDDAMELAPLYDKYEFPMGIKLCDTVLYEDLRSRRDEEEPDLFVETFVPALVLSHKINLRKTNYWGRSWLECQFIRPWKDNNLLRSFTKEDIELFVPIIIRDGELQSFSGTDAYGGRITCEEEIAEYLDGSGEEINAHLHSTIKGFLDSDGLFHLSNLDLSNPMFPALLFAKILLTATEEDLERRQYELETTKTQLRNETYKV